MTIKKCKHCTHEFDTDNCNYPSHVRWCMSNPKRLQLIEERKEIKCNRIRKKKIISDAQKLKISMRMKIAHAEGRHPGWKNANRNNKSYPEKYFDKKIRERGLYEKYTISTQFSSGKYFFDFAILDIKLDIEIDGSQHSRSSYNIEYDKRRDDDTISKGWKVYRISVKELYENCETTIDNLMSFIESESKYRIYDHEEIKRHFKPLIKTYRDKQLDLIEIIKESNIDFSKSGWVNKVSELTGKRTQKIKYWMIEYMPDFYEKYCFKRNTLPRKKSWEFESL